MVRFLPIGYLLLLTTAAQAQQADTLAADSLPARSITIRDPSYVTVLTASSRGLTTIQPLLSRTAGVQYTPYSGAPGAGAVVRIRGAASIDSHVQPLYIVDGVPVFQYRFNTFSELARFNPPPINPDASTNPLLSIAPEDVEKIEVLKGAFDTGQYGFLGQNGVIRITTRRGAASQPLRVQYTASGGVQTARHRYSLLGAREAAELTNEAARNNGYAPEYTPAEIAGFGAGTDWQAEVLRIAAMQEHHLALSGGTAHGTRYYAGLDYLNQQGIVRSTDLQRYGLRLNLDQTVGQHLRLSAGLSYSQIAEHRPTASLLPLALRLLPTVPVYEANGDYATDYGAPNPVQVANQNLSTPYNRRLLAHAELAYEIATGLTLALRAAFERDSLLARDYQGPTNYYARIDGFETGVRGASHQQLTLNPALRYRRTLAERHVLAASLEATGWRNQQSQSFLERTVPVPPFALPPGRTAGSMFSSTYNLFSYQLLASYTYAGRYALQGSLRADKSAQAIGPEKQQWLPAAEATWHAAQEAWLKDRGPVSTLDAWVGGGQTSNRGNYAGAHGLGFLGGPSSSPFFFPLDELTTQADAGLRLGLAHDQLSFSASVYQRDTRAKLGYPGQQLPPVYVRNRGLELSLAGTWQAGRLHGSSGLTAAFNRNHYDQPTDNGIKFYVPGRNFAYTSGQPLGSFYGYRYRGLNAAGNPLFDSPNGNLPSPQILSAGIPRQLLGFVQQLTYGKLDLQLQLDGMFGYDVFDNNLLLLDVPRGGFNATTRVRDRWTPTHTNTDVPRAGSQVNNISNTVSNYTLQSGNHVRLSSVVLTAEVWRKAPHAVSVFLSGTNLLVISAYRGFDPNVSAAEDDPRQAGLDQGAYPVARTVSLGVRATL
ncbi:TonB-dependent receptor plug domain-containing protein [Hymenobacter sp. UYCo722]|uniref:TonB-dependent receptor plug domain-containing protein n=1 Tax=Hymenobacter sp. UYCo722 TaxID=3156335 RepID=UPI003391540E